RAQHQTVRRKLRSKKLLPCNLLFLQGNGSVMLQIQAVINTRDTTATIIRSGQLSSDIITDSNTKICPEACPQTVAHTVKAVVIVFGPDDDRRICQGLASDHDVAMIGTAIAMHDVEGFTLQKAAQAPDL